ncbi:hypothetical protein GCM10027047_35530 [Rhodococcus aerolatus]
MSDYAGVSAGAAAGAAGGAVLSIGGKNLVFAPETIEATIGQLQGVLDQINAVRRMKIQQFAGHPAALDFASSNAVENLHTSAARLLARMEEAAQQVEAAITNLRANGSAYLADDRLP